MFFFILCDFDFIGSFCWVQFPEGSNRPDQPMLVPRPRSQPLIRFASSCDHGPHARQPLDRSFGLSPRPGTAGIAPQLPSITCRGLAGILYILCCFFHHEVLQSHVSFAVLLREPGFGCAPLAARGLPDFASLWRSFTAERSSSQSFFLAVQICKHQQSSLATTEVAPESTEGES